MKRLIFYVATLLTCVGPMSANEINVENVTIPQGEQQEIQVLYSFDKADAYIGYAFKMAMPTGISTVKDTDGYPIYVLDENNQGFNMNVTADDGFGALPQNASVTIDGTEGVLLTLTLQADASLEVGSTHVVNISSIMLTENVENSQQSVYLENTSFTVTIGEPTDKHIILDEASTIAPETATGVDVRVKRTIKADEWSTICLPFAMTEAQVKEAFGEDVQLADFTGYEVEEDEDGNVAGLSVNFSDVDAIEANHPYLIKVSAAVSEFTVDGVDIAPEEEPTVATVKRTRKQWSEFIGTYTANTVVPEKTLFLNGNKFWYSTGATKMKAFRGYFDFYDVLTEVDELYAKVRFVVDGEATAIGTVAAESLDNAVYSVSGVRLGTTDKLKELPKGFYIVNGKKVYNQ